MSRQPSNYGPNFETEDAIGGFLDVVAKICLYGGAVACLIGIGFLVFNYVHFQGAQTDSAGALNNIGLMSKLLMAGSLATAVGSTYLFWGEELLHGVQLLLAGALVFAPLYLPMMLGSTDSNSIGAAALSGIQLGGIILGVIGVGALLVELVIKMRMRSIQGSRADQLKFGKGIKEERYQNKFMGKCWQLPYCRKFVRERCPIYHAKRTCWKERVGCMCEEEVIRNAMENRPIPKDAVAAARYIPVNNKITMTQKKERCRQCVIYNEHLKHQYKLMLPTTICTFILIYAALRGPLLAMSGGAIEKINHVLGGLTYEKGGGPIQAGGIGIFQEVILDCFMFVLLAYVLKLLEYVIFKLKV